ncbi:MAG: hypothetical protein ACK5LJ_04610 [Paracoccus sp. (in: a-proteobacteria)]
MSRFFLIISLLVMLPWPALARDLLPAEPPPPDFQATQYIDSHGCVFVLDGVGWTARLAEDGAPICGFPPSMGGRAAPVAGSAQASGMSALKHQLTVTILSQDGGGGGIIPAPGPALGHGGLVSEKCRFLESMRAIKETDNDEQTDSRIQA